MRDPVGVYFVKARPIGGVIGRMGRSMESPIEIRSRRSIRNPMYPMGRPMGLIMN